MVVSAIHQHESAIGICMSPSSWTSLPPPTSSHSSRLSQSTRSELPESYSKFPLAILLYIWWCIFFNELLLAQSSPTLCNSMDYNPPGSSVHGILQARILEWVGISFSGNLPDPGIEPRSPTFQADSLSSAPPGKPLSYQQLCFQLFINNWTVLYPRKVQRCPCTKMFSPKLLLL